MGAKKKPTRVNSVGTRKMTPGIVLALVLLGASPALAESLTASDCRKFEQRPGESFDQEKADWAAVCWQQVLDQLEAEEARLIAKMETEAAFHRGEIPDPTGKGRQPLIDAMAELFCRDKPFPEEIATHCEEYNRPWWKFW